MQFLRAKWWGPYIVGALIGVLSWFSFASVDKPLGITTAFEYSAALAIESAAPEVAVGNTYYSEHTKPDNTPKIDWEWMLVIGVFIGAWASSKLSADRPGPADTVPPTWHRRFGPSVAKRYLGAFLGGTMLMFGARLAQGCTSGHGISGTMQLAVSSWLFVTVFVATSVAAAFFIYGAEQNTADDGGRHV